MEQLDLFADATPEPPARPVPTTFQAAPKARRVATLAAPLVSAASSVSTPAAAHSVTGRRAGPRPQLISGAEFGEKIAAAWYGAWGNTNMAIPVGVVAALALWPHKSPGAAHAAALGEFITAYPAEQLPSGLGEVVAHYWWQRPDLIDVASPIFQWMEEDHERGVLRAIKIVANTAIKHGVLIHTGDVDPENRSHEDLLSWTISALRHESGRAGLGEVLTPDPICDLMSYIALDVDNLPDGAWLNDPASGAGGMFRSAAQRLREAGRDPHSFRWALQDIDPMSAAGAAVNVMVWDLGIGAVVSCGDTLSEGDLTMRALAHQQAAFEHRDRMVAAASTAAALHQVEQLIGRATADGVAA